MAFIEMPLQPRDFRRLEAATGFLELGMYFEADSELDELIPEVRHLPEILSVRYEIYSALEKWELAQIVARRLHKYDPDNLGWIISLAYSTRRVDGIGNARPILEAALHTHRKEAIIFYNLACYSCVEGDYEKTKEYLQQSFLLNPAFKLTSLSDTDLASFWTDGIDLKLDS